MTLPAPNLDDRRFQELVDEAKRMVQRRCPDWTDHNVSDPGVTLIETFAYMVDQLIYRVNQVPERNYVKFLELIGVRLHPPRAAHTGVTFWLSAPQAEPVEIPLGTVVATERGDDEDLVSFTTTEARRIVPCQLSAVVVQTAAGATTDQTENLVRADGFLAFSPEPVIGDALMVGLSAAVPGCAVALRLNARIEGVGVNPNDPPIAWQAFNGTEWVGCDVDSDGTKGINQPGDIVLHVPADHAMSVVEGRHAGWLRGVLTPLVGAQKAYSASPRILSIEASTVGGTAAAVHARVVEPEVLGVSEGVPSQRFRLRHRPVVPTGEPMVLEVEVGKRWQTWNEVESFAYSRKEDAHFVLDYINGEVQFGPVVRQADGGLLQNGAVPTAGSTIRIGSYRTGGGRRGNVASGTLTVLKSTIPIVSTTTNRRPAAGGVNGETMESAKDRGPSLLRTRGRAVTAEDYEHLVRERFNGVARVRCHEDPVDFGLVHVLIVPDVVEEPSSELRFAQLKPPADLMEAIRAHLDERRCVGARVLVEMPKYAGVKIGALLRAGPRADPARLDAEARSALYRYFHPITGGRSGTGWEFGRAVNMGEVYATLQRVPGIEYVEDAQIYPVNPNGGKPGAEQARIDLSADSLVFSVDHRVTVEQ